MFLGNLNCIVQPFASRGLVKLGDVRLKKKPQTENCTSTVRGL